MNFTKEKQNGDFANGRCKRLSQIFTKELKGVQIKLKHFYDALSQTLFPRSKVCWNSLRNCKMTASDNGKHSNTFDNNEYYSLCFCNFDMFIKMTFWVNRNLTICYCRSIIIWKCQMWNLNKFQCILCGKYKHTVKPNDLHYSTRQFCAVRQFQWILFVWHMVRY